MEEGEFRNGALVTSRQELEAPPPEAEEAPPEAGDAPLSPEEAAEESAPLPEAVSGPGSETAAGSSASGPGTPALPETPDLGAPKDPANGEDALGAPLGGEGMG